MFLKDCEGDVYDLNCPDGQIIIIEDAFYGRSDISTCQYPDCYTNAGPCAQMQNTQCSSANAMPNVALTCFGKQKCSIPINSDYFQGDPCGGTYKYAKIKYDCMPFVNP